MDYATGARLGPLYSGQAVGYRLVTLAGTEVLAFTTSNVAETTIPGDYTVAGGVPVPAGFVGRVVWGTAGRDLAEEVFAGVAYAPSPYPAAAALGPLFSGLAVGYRLVDLAGATAAAFTTAGVTEDTIPGDYVAAAGVPLPSDFRGRVVWGTSARDLAEEWVNGVFVPPPPLPPAAAPRVTSFRSAGVVSSPSPATDRRPDPGFSTGKAV